VTAPRLVAELRESVRATGLLGERGPVVAMISGGRDSVCLLDVAVALRGASSVCGLHLNYGLRGAESDRDERHCTELCARLGAELRVVRAQRRGRAEGNLQAWARELRYDAASQLAQELDAPPESSRIATGHTASDQLETILYRLAASPGRRALLGMSAREGRLVRPLLGVTREQTAAYCRERGLCWREDESNDDERFARVRVRRRLVPALLAIHPAARESVLRTAERLREESRVLDGLVREALGDSPTGDSIALERLAGLDAALARLVVVRLAEGAAGGYVPQAGARLAEILALWRRAGRGEVHVGGNVSAVIAEGRLRMRRLPRRGARDACRQEPS
jgi:tRNA(Ile)-lysidine synthase